MGGYLGPLRSRHARYEAVQDLLDQIGGERLQMEGASVVVVTGQGPAFRVILRSDRG